MEGVEDIPGTALHEGLSWEWETFADYLDALERQPRDIDARRPGPPRRPAPLRDGRAGRRPRAGDTRGDRARWPSSPRRRSRPAPSASPPRAPQPPDQPGEWTPTLTAAADELVGIAGGLGAAGKGVLQVVSDLFDLDDEIATFGMAEESGRPMSISLAQSPIAPDQFRGALDGSPTPTTAASGAGPGRGPAGRHHQGLQATLSPLDELGRTGRSRTCRSPSASPRSATGVRARILAEVRTMPVPVDHVFELGDPPDYEPDRPTSIARPGRRATASTPRRWPTTSLLADDGQACCTSRS